jgi:hypothetical protein
MKLTRAILCGALLWILIFFEVSILMFGFGLNTGLTYYIIHYLIVIPLVLIVGLVYFSGKRIKKGAGEGLLAGIVFAVTGVVLDAIITVPLFVKTYSFFADVYLWLGIIEGIIIITIVGAVKK